MVPTAPSRARPAARTLAAPRQARSVATRRRLLDAGVASLIECGLARTTTTEVCQRAGVSQGALFKHFPSKAQLLAGTVEHLFGELIDRFRLAFGEIARKRRGDARLREAVRCLWGVFRSPELEAAFELYVAARTDLELRAALGPVMARHRANLEREAWQLFPEAARDNPRFGAAIDTVLNAMQGAALGGLALEDPEAERRHLDFLEALARQELGATGGGRR